MKRFAAIVVLLFIVFLAVPSAKAEGPKPEELYNVTFWTSHPPLTRGVWGVEEDETTFYTAMGGCFGYSDGHFGVFNADWDPMYEVPYDSLVLLKGFSSENPDAVYFFTVSRHGVFRVANGDENMISENRKSVFFPMAMVDLENSEFRVIRDAGVTPSYFAYRQFRSQLYREGVQTQGLARECNP